MNGAPTAAIVILACWSVMFFMGLWYHWNFPEIPNAIYTLFKMVSLMFTFDLIQLALSRD